MVNKILKPVLALVICLVGVSTWGVEEQACSLKRLNRLVKLGKGRSIEEYSAAWLHILKEGNPGIDPESVGTVKFVNMLSRMSQNTGGVIPPPVYNHRLAGLEAYLATERAVVQSGLPADFMHELCEHYADRCLVDGLHDADSAVQGIKSIPPDSHFVKVQTGDRLDGLVLKFHPGFKDLTDEQKKEVFDYLVEINPFVEEPGMIHDAPGPGRDIALKIFGNRDKACSLHVPSKGYTLYYFLRENHTIAIPKQLPHLPTVEEK